MVQNKGKKEKGEAVGSDVKFNGTATPKGKGDGFVQPVKIEKKKGGMWTLRWPLGTE